MLAVTVFTLIYEPLLSSLGSLENKGMNCWRLATVLVVLVICWQKVTCEIRVTSAPSKVFFTHYLVAFQAHFFF